MWAKYKQTLLTNMVSGSGLSNSYINCVISRHYIQCVNQQLMIMDFISFILLRLDYCRL